MPQLVSYRGAAKRGAANMKWACNVAPPPCRLYAASTRIAADVWMCGSALATVLPSGDPQVWHFAE